MPDLRITRSAFATIFFGLILDFIQGRLPADRFPGTLTAVFRYILSETDRPADDAPDLHLPTYLRCEHLVDRAALRRTRARARAAKRKSCEQNVGMHPGASAPSEREAPESRVLAPQAASRLPACAPKASRLPACAPASNCTDAACRVSEAPREVPASQLPSCAPAPNCTDAACRVSKAPRVSHADISPVLSTPVAECIETRHAASVQCDAPVLDVTDIRSVRAAVAAGTFRLDTAIHSPLNPQCVSHHTVTQCAENRRHVPYDPRCYVRYSPNPRPDDDKIFQSCGYDDELDARYHLFDSKGRLRDGLRKEKTWMLDAAERRLGIASAHDIWVNRFTDNGPKH